MAKLKGIKKIDRIINNFTKNFNIKADLGEEFLAYCDDRLINYTLVIDEADINYFIEDAKKRYPDVQADIFLWSLMHEIFHVITDNMWTPEELDYFEEKKEEIYLLSNDELDLKNDFYHCLPDEFMATKMAANYMRKHSKEISKFWIKLQKAIISFYKRNGLI